MEPSRSTSDNASDKGGISDCVTLNAEVTDTKSHTLVRNLFTAFLQSLLPAKFRAVTLFFLAISF